MQTVPFDSWSERMMTHLKVLCKEIGPRPSTSEKEKSAAEYVKKILRSLGIREVMEQGFNSPNTLGWVVLPCLAATAIAAPFAWFEGTWMGKIIGILLSFGSAIILRQFMLARLPFFHRFMPSGVSQNVIARIPAAGSALRQVFLVGHLDTQKQRLVSPPPDVGKFPLFVSGLILWQVLTGLLFILDMVLNIPAVGIWDWAACAVNIFLFWVFVLEERHPHVEGANDNASAVALLLATAEALHSQPLQNTEVTLLFTGCEEVICVGMERYLKLFKPPKEASYWIDLEMVGSGKLCYVTRHGVTPLGHYSPDPQMAALAAKTAEKCPELGVTGKEMIILEEVANLRRRKYRAVCLAGYNGQGYLPNWHRLSDKLENIQEVSLSRAGQFTWALLHEIDMLEKPAGVL